GANGTSVTGQITGNGAEDGTAISGKLTASDLDGLDSTTPYSVSGAAQHGTATIDANGNWSYTPKADYNGADSFTVTVKDALGNLTTQVINITVAAEKDAFDDSGSTTSGQTVKIDVLANDAFEGAHKVVTQVNGTAITAGGAAVAVANGQVTLGTDGQLSFKANAGYTGTAEFNYTVKTDDGTPETA
ncbi:Ig-like domain-containing protein, partial [Comamonas suwonensis]